MNQMNLRKKILFMVVGIAIISPIVAGIIIYKNQQNSILYKSIAEKALPRTREMGSLLFSFREVRIHARSLAIRGNTQAMNDAYLSSVLSSIATFKKSKSELAALLSETEEERKMVVSMEQAWSKFESFGGTLIALNKIGDQESLNKLADEVRNTCPKLAQEFEIAVQEMIDWQRKRAVNFTAMANDNSKATVTLSFILVILGVLGSFVFGLFFSSSLVKGLTQNIVRLSEAGADIDFRSGELSQISITLSESTGEQSASLQETAASMDEISAMVRRNSDSALSAAKTSEDATQIVREGQGRVQQMITSINGISDGNLEVMEQMKHSNDQISEIVNVIKNIAAKTNVINDIVFQTKLLSFNASVEAARAGDHGKGFSVVAEEVGNLASMSGNAAKEISCMLEDSVVRVSTIVTDSRTLMESLMSKNRIKIDSGAKMASECGQVFDQILGNVMALNAMVNEIATASREQTSGIEEVNKAVSQLEIVTQETATSSQLSSESAMALKVQSDSLYGVVNELEEIINGSGQKKDAGGELVAINSSNTSKAA